MEDAELQHWVAKLRQVSDGHILETLGPGLWNIDRSSFSSLQASLDKKDARHFKKWVLKRCDYAR